MAEECRDHGDCVLMGGGCMDVEKGAALGSMRQHGISSTSAVAGSGVRGCTSIAPRHSKLPESPSRRRTTPALVPATPGRGGSGPAT